MSIYTFCQVSLQENIPIIEKNYKNLKKFYKKIKIYVICPDHQIKKFKESLDLDDIEIINEDSIISFHEFKNIYLNLTSTMKYKNEFDQRLKWYYQQILKICYVIKYISINKKNIIIWDADTIILKKIKFFDNGHSIKNGNFFEFHKQYFKTNKSILKIQPNYFISFLNQFISITQNELEFFLKKIKAEKITSNKMSTYISYLILKNIFDTHVVYNGSMFSEYELLGQSSYLLNKKKQIPIITLRFGLNGILSDSQISLVRLLNFKHITYEHRHQNKNSIGMLSRNQTWPSLIKIIIKSLIKHYLRLIKHNLNYMINRYE